MGALQKVGISLIAAFALGIAAPADAQEIDWDGHCADEGEGLEAEVAALVRPSTDRASLEVFARVTGDTSLRIELALSRDGEPLGRRSLEGAACEELVSAAALVVALTLDPAALVTAVSAPVDLPTDAPAAAPTPTSPPPSSAPPPAEALGPPPQRAASAPRPARNASSDEAIRRSRARSIAPDEAAPTLEAPVEEGEALDLDISLGVAAALDAGALPIATPGIEARIGMALGPLRLEAAGRWFFEQESGLGQHPTGRGHFGMATGSLGACLPVGVGPVVLGPCLGAEAGAIWGSATGVSDPGEGTSAWVAPWGAAMLGADVASWLRLRLDVGVTVPVVRTDFVVDGIGSVHSSAPVTFRAGLGAEVHFR